LPAKVDISGTSCICPAAGMHVTIERAKLIASATRLDVRVKRLGWRLLRFWLIADVFPVKLDSGIVH
jgi:hypothetical protein